MEDSNKIDGLDKKSIFKVPDGYFERLPDKITARIKEVELQKNRPAIRPLYIYLSAAASVLIIAIFIFKAQDTAVKAEDMLAQIDTADLIDYLAETDIALDEIISEIDWSDEQLDFDKLEYLEEDISDADLDEYLDNVDENFEVI